MEWPNLLEMLMTGADVRMLNGTVLEGWPAGYPPAKVIEASIRAGVIRNGELVDTKLFAMTNVGLDQALAHVRNHIRARNKD